MNPFKIFMNSMMMGLRCTPFMSFGCGMPFMPSLFCGSNFMSMPYYQGDNLWFFNSPIYRNTSYDYLLDPSLAMKNVQAQIQSGGLYGNTMLPGFTFPQIGGLNTGLQTLSGASNMPEGTNTSGTANTQGVAQQPEKTPEQIEAEQKKAEEDDKPAHKAAVNLYGVFNKVKEVAEKEKENNEFPELGDEIIQKAEDAMSKETADEQYEAMQEVISAIPADVLRKTVLADSSVKTRLRNAGYNFNLRDNNGVRYSLSNNIDPNEITHIARLTEMHNTLQDVKLDVNARYNEFQNVFSALSCSNILEIISTWNSEFNGPNEKGILRFIANNLPDEKAKNTIGPLVRSNIITFVGTLVKKAKTYEGYAKIQKEIKNVNDQLEIFSKSETNKNNIYKLADACDKLYARLRMQEALEINRYINKNEMFQDLGIVTENVIDENIVIEETIKDLQAENITAPNVDDLDEVKQAEKITIDGNGTTQADADAEAEEEYAEDKQALVEEYLVSEKHYLTKVSDDSNVYKTNIVSSEKYLTCKNGKFVEVKEKTDGSCFERYFTVKDNKLIEVTKKADGSGFEEPTDAKEVTAVEIGKQDAAVKKAQKLIDENKIVEYKIDGFNKFPLFKATGKNQFFAIIDGQFGKIKPTSKFDKDFAEKLTVENFDTSFSEGDIVTAEKVKAEAVAALEEKERAENKDVTDVENLNFTSLAYAKSKDGRYEIEKALTDKEPESLSKCIVKPLNVEGYFLVTKPKRRYYRYDEVNNKLVYLKDVVNISDDGYMKIETKKDGKKTSECKECGEAITNDLSKVNDYNETIQEYSKKYVSSVSQSDTSHVTQDSCRKLNTLIAMNDVNFTVNFIRGYQKHKRWWNNSFCEQIVKENGITDGKNIDSINSKRRYLAKIASLIINVFNETTFDINKYSQATLDKYYSQLEEIANGKLYIPVGADSFSGGCLDSEIKDKDKLIQTAATLDNIIKIVLESYKDETEQQEKN